MSFSVLSVGMNVMFRIMHTLTDFQGTGCSASKETKQK